VGLTLKPALSLKVLDFDIECRPLSYTGWGTTDEITSIAWSWSDSDSVRYAGLPSGMQAAAEFEAATRLMLLAFVADYAKADMVTGHYIRNFDLPKVNGALIDCGLPVLSQKITSCTKNDLRKFSGLSKSQENLGLLLGKFNSSEYLSRKEHVAQMEWRQVNRLTDEGIQENKRRVVGDVKQHKELRVALIQAGLLKPPKLWSA